MWKTTGIKPPELEPPCELNEMFYEPWKTFLELHSSRQSNGMSVSPISFTEIFSYTKLYDMKLDAWEIDIIKLFDNCALEVISKNEKKRSAKNGSKK